MKTVSEILTFFDYQQVNKILELLNINQTIISKIKAINYKYKSSISKEDINNAIEYYKKDNNKNFGSKLIHCHIYRLLREQKMTYEQYKLYINH